MNSSKSLFRKALFFSVSIVTIVLNTATAQSCSGSWATSNLLSYDCISGQWIGSTNPETEPVGCPVAPVFIADQTNTFTFNNPVNSFSIDFNAFSTGPGCARMEIKINGVFYPLTASNLVDLPAASGCMGLFSAIALTPEGYITSSASSMLQTNGQGRIIVSGVNASGITISTNDGAGSVFTDPFNCIDIVPLKLENFTGIASANCITMILWKTGIELNVKNIELQNSPDGIVFKKVADVLPKGSNSQYSVTHNFTDEYFRLRINDLDGRYMYSEIIKVKDKCNTPGYEVYPNPTHSSIEIKGFKKEDKLLFLDMLGRIVLKFDSAPNNNKFDIQELAMGVYNLKIVNGERVMWNFKLIKN